ncbi:MAG: guanylate kinase [Betaproteobacteria bacterium]|nr:MAG: guanylate kinase [Betaproteobacteria bacterium]
MAGPTGNLFVVAAPSGGGKTSLTRALLEREPGILLSVSYTTRPPRPGEIDGLDYHFVTPDRFAALKSAGEFLECARVHGNWYATSATWLKAQVDSGRDVLLEIDWQGALQVRKLVPESVQIFILPPVIINQDFASAVDDLAAIVRASRLRSAQQCVRYRGLLAQLT